MMKEENEARGEERTMKIIRGMVRKGSQNVNIITIPKKDMIFYDIEIGDWLVLDLKEVVKKKPKVETKHLSQPIKEAEDINEDNAQPVKPGRFNIFKRR